MFLVNVNVLIVPNDFLFQWRTIYNLLPATFQEVALISFVIKHIIVNLNFREFINRLRNIIKIMFGKHLFWCNLIFHFLFILLYTLNIGPNILLIVCILIRNAHKAVTFK